MPTHLNSLSLLLFVAFLCTCTLHGEEVNRPLRRPIALGLTSDDSTIVVANRCGSLVLLDTAAKQIIQEQQIGAKFSDMVALGNGDWLVTDEKEHKLLQVRQQENQFTVSHSISVPPYPVSVRATASGEWLSVASLWSRQVAIISRSKTSGEFGGARTVDLSFAPRAQIVLPNQQEVLVFDAFGGRLAIIALSTAKVVLEREIPGHSVRGLVCDDDGENVLLAHQMLNPHAHANRNDLHWGLLISNDVRWLSMASVRDMAKPIYSGGRVVPLGLPGRGQGDPAGVAMNKAGLVAVCAAGVNEVMFGKRDDDAFRAVKVGRRPTALMFSRDQKHLFVANTFSDSISLLDTNSFKVVAEIPLAAKRERSLVEQGEELFFDARFSHEGWLSCHSCHVDGHTNFALNDNLSDGGFGAPKMVISLLGRRGTAPFAWNAGVADLSAQVRNSLEKTMQSDHPAISQKDLAAFTAYIESLPSPPSVGELRGKVDAPAVARGKEIFGRLECAQCHAPPNFTVSRTEDVQLLDEVQQRRFNPPSLLGISQRDAFLHDARAKSLPDVFLKHRHPHEREWQSDEVADLVAYLRSL
jgi:YVTN family beta-propeller protein